MNGEYGEVCVSKWLVVKVINESFIFNIFMNYKYESYGKKRFYIFIDKVFFKKCMIEKCFRRKM